MINYGVLTVSIVHLTGLSSKLIELWPHMLSSFSKEMTSVFNIYRGIQICTVVLVVLDMNQRNQIIKIPKKRGLVLKVWIRLEVLNSIDAIATGDVV